MTGVQMLSLIKSVNIRDEIHTALENTKEYALNYQAQQMFEGKRSTGGDIKPRYSTLTVKIKREKGQVTDRVTLRDTGYFYHSLYFVVKPESFEFKSSDKKQWDIIDKYGVWVFGLNPTYRKLYVEEILRYEYINNIKNKFIK